MWLVLSVYLIILNCIIIIEVGAMKKSLGISRNKYEILQASKSNLARKKNMYIV